MFQSKSKGRVRLTPQLSSQTGVPYYFVFLSYSVVRLIGWGLRTLGRTTCFTQAAASDVDLTQNNVWPNI